LMLHILCGFSAREVAAAFVAGPAAIEKRITRAKNVLARSRRLFDLARGDDVLARLPAVQRALYLLFNEGYHGASAGAAVRSELCGEALRLTGLLCADPRTATPSTFALSALLCLHVARLPARMDAEGELLSLFDQDRGRWDRARITEGERLLERSATGDTLSEYHLEAAIAWVHAVASRVEDTDWERIVTLYDQLIRIRPSPVVALNRAIAVAQRDGPERGLTELGAIADRDRLAGYPFYAAAQGELELRCGRAEAAREHFRTALGLARNPNERRFFRQRVMACAG
ncbi:MAG TPA: DUF6596 domain-containing protein, partial [Dongiaceae bacterium]|nr:DUF6596 domain-containing protein [Dongiaceae bacterium]